MALHHELMPVNGSCRMLGRAFLFSLSIRCTITGQQYSQPYDDKNLGTADAGYEDLPKP